MGMTLSAVTAAVWSGVIHSIHGWNAQAFFENVRTFAAGDAVGLFVVVPFLLFVVWPRTRKVKSEFEPSQSVYVGSPDEAIHPSSRKSPLRVRHFAEALVLLVALTICIWASLRHVSVPLDGTLLLLIPLAWIALREGSSGSALVVFLYGVTCVGLVVLGVSPESEVAKQQGELILLAFVGLLLGASKTASTQSAARYWHLVATAAEGIWRLDKEGRTLYLNPRMAQILGRNAEDVLGQPAGAFIAPENKGAWKELREQREAGHEGTYETQVVRADGTRAPVLVTASPVRSAATNEIVGSVAVVTDLTAAREAERQRRQLQLLLEAAFHSARDAMFLTKNSDQQIVDVNDAAVAFSGLSREELIGTTATAVGLWADPADQARLAEVLREHGAALDFEVTFNRRQSDGSRELRNAILYTRFIRLEDENYTMIAARDITAEKRVADAQRQVKRMEELGRLAGGVAHDFNNLLTVVLSYTHMAIVQAESGEPVEVNDLREIQRAGERGREMTRRLLAFSRHLPIEFRPLDICAVLDKAVPMLKSLLENRIELEIHCEQSLPRIMGDSGQVDQVLLNLVLNARDAIPRSGKIGITVAKLNVPEGEASLLVGPDAIPGTYVSISVRDTGQGMSPEVRSRIFEPFFTTKAPDKGTGLGLAVVFGIIRQARGGIRVESTPGHGSVFTLFWPAATLASVVPSETGGAANVWDGRGEHILLVEDEPSVARITRRILEDAGYQVTSTGDGTAALECVEQLQRRGGHPSSS
jgi:PAS domain S-box-containing protein